MVTNPSKLTGSRMKMAREEEVEDVIARDAKAQTEALITCDNAMPFSY